MTNTTNAIAAIEEGRAIEVMQNSLYPGASTESVRMVMDYCKARSLDPFQKPVHIVPMWDSKTKQMHDVIMPGLNLYRTQAATSGCLAGISEPQFGQVKEFNFGGAIVRAPESCRVTVKRILPSGTIAEFTAVEYFEEAVSTSKEGKPTPMWLKRPRGMLAKTAESQALRKGFPDVAGASETAEEMEGKSYFQTDTPPATASAVLSEADKAFGELAYAEAQKGKVSYFAWCKTLDENGRATLTRLFPDYLKSVYTAADNKKIATDAEVVEP